MITNRFIRLTLLFLTGGYIYCTLEVITRGYSHISMLIAGGVCFVFISYINEFYSDRLSTIEKMALSAVFITIVEFITGIIVNIWLKMNVWDYSNLPLNYRGQVCILYMVVWFLISYLGIILDRYIKFWLMGDKV